MSSFKIKNYGLHKNCNIAGHGLLAIKGKMGAASTAGHGGLKMDFEATDSVYSFVIGETLVTESGALPPLLRTTIVPRDLR